MIEKLLGSYLKWTDKGYLVPFLEGLTHMGRPSSVLFPSELMEQGLAVILSGLNNTMAVQSNPDWVWPYWVERQGDPDGEEFIPTAINLIKTNLTCRNWTSLGLEDSPREAMIDQVGMLTLHPYGWSVFPYVRLDGRDHFPPRMLPGRKVRQHLLEGTLPCVVTTYAASPSLEWSSQAMALRLDGEELLGYTHTLANPTHGHLSFRFGLAIRPYNPLTMGHINSIRYQDRLWKVNGAHGLLLLDDPDRVVISDRHHGDPLLRDVLIAGRKSLKSRSGIACGLAEYDVELAPGETRILESLGIMGRRSAKIAPLRLAGISAAALRGAQARHREKLRGSLQEGLRIGIPDARLEEAFLAVKGHIHVFDDGDHFSPGTFLYHNHWFRDSAYIALAFENMGWASRVEPKLRAYPALQTADGFFKSQKGEWDSNGEAMWAMVNHVRRGADPSLLDRFFPSLLKGARWIARMRDETRTVPSPHYGLLPPGFSAEHFGPNDHYYWDNLWSLAGLEAFQWAAEKLGREKEDAWVSDLIQDYRGDLCASMDWAWKKNGRKALPCSPYRSLDSAAIGNLVGLSPLDVLGPEEPWLKGTLDYLAAHNLRDGLFFQKIVHTGLNPYLSVQMARVMMALGDPRWMGILEALLRRATSTFTWPEALHPRMFGGCMGDGDHGWSASEFLNLIRDMLVVERAGTLRLAEGVPAEWFKPGLHLEIAGAPSLHGTLDYSLRQGIMSASFTWNLRRFAHQDRAPLWLRLPRASGLEPALECAVPPGGAAPRDGALRIDEVTALSNAAPHDDSYRILLPGDSGTMTLYPAGSSGQGGLPLHKRKIHV